MRACAARFANARGVKFTELDGIKSDANRPAEQWFAPISKGDKPLVNAEGGADTDAADANRDEITGGVAHATWALYWIDEWIESRTFIAKSLTTTTPMGGR